MKATRQEQKRKGGGVLIHQELKPKNFSEIGQLKKEEEQELNAEE